MIEIGFLIPLLALALVLQALKALARDADEHDRFP